MDYLCRIVNSLDSAVLFLLSTICCYLFKVNVSLNRLFDDILEDIQQLEEKVIAKKLLVL